MMPKKQTLSPCYSQILSHESKVTTLMLLFKFWEEIQTPEIKAQAEKTLVYLLDNNRTHAEKKEFIARNAGELVERFTRLIEKIEEFNKAILLVDALILHIK